MLCVSPFRAWTFIAILSYSHCQTDTSCSSNDIRLVDGRNENEGRLEVCQFGIWGTICNDRWNFSSTTVACRQLGIGHRGYAVKGYPIGTGTIAWSQVRCSGEEQSLSECNHISIPIPLYCFHSEDVQLVCLKSESRPECKSGSIHLAGSSAMSGRLEVCIEGVWGTVCSRYIRDIPSAANVACNQLGDNTIQAFASGGVPGVGPIFLRTLRCSGDEDSILDCPAVTTIPYDVCTSYWDLSIYCYNTTEPECLDGEVRLIDGDTDLEGRLEVCLEGIWGSVCDNSWTEESSLVVCQQLGINVTSTHFGRYGMNSSPYFLNHVKCTGNEESIFDCPSLKYPSLSMLVCHEYEAVGILCRNSSLMECTEGEIHLVDSYGAETNESSGIVQLCYNGVWNTLCDSTWSVLDATRACRDLNLPITEGVVGLLDQSTFITGPMAQLRCSGSGDLFSTCKSYSCSQRGYAAVFCGPPEDPVCSDGDLLLTGSDAPNEGRLEICHLGLWGTICDDFWTLSNTYVSCRQLGFEAEGATYWSRRMYTGEGPIFVDTIVCEGNEDNLTSCSHQQARNLHNCIHYEDIYVSCSTAGATKGTTIASKLVTTEMEKANTEIKTSRTETETSRAEPDTAETKIAATETTSIASSGGVNTLIIIISLIIAVTSVVIVVIVIVFVRRKRIVHKKLNAQAALNMITLSNEIVAERSEGNIYSTTTNKVVSRKTSTAILMDKLSLEFRIENKYLTLLTKIGEGEFGIVYKAELKRPGDQGEIVAVKTLKGAYTDAEVDEILEEALKLKSFVHQNVLNLIGVSFQGCDTPFIVMPFMMNGSLLSYLRKDKKSLVLPKETDEYTVEDVSKRLTAMCQQIACGMEYLAGKKFVHRDLAARNCMIDNHGVIKIADFGLSEEVYSKTYFRQDSHRTVKMPIKWMAVESLHEGIFSEKTDVWAYGITCWEVFSGGKTPYPGISPPGVMEMLENGERLALPNNAACTSNMYDIMKKCWMDDPNDRPTFSDIKTSLDQSLEEMADYLAFGLEIFHPQQLSSIAEQESDSIILQNPNTD